MVDRPRRLPGEAGVWIVVLGEMTVFALLFGVHLHYRAADPRLFAVAQERLSEGLGVLGTLLLLTSSGLVVRGTLAVRRADVIGAPRWFVGAAACGVGFIAVKGVEWRDKLAADLAPGTNDFWTYYYVLTGLHLLHLVIGLGVLGLLAAWSRRPQLDARRLDLVVGGACYWHMVDLLWIVVFPLLYLVR